ncbi:MAG: acyltransferase [Oscillospiraceae bacterium]|nr:acyltransferase [Oscillospiraceae bacterium]
MDKTRELENCNSVRAFLMLCIVLYHSMALYSVGGWSPFSPVEEAPYLGIIAEWLNSFHIYAFTLVSGYVFYYMRIEKGRYADYLPFVANKAKRLLVPYVFMCTIWVAPVYCYFYGTGGVVSKFVLGVNPGQLWYLLMLFWVFVLFWTISKFADKHPFVGTVIVCLFYFTGWLLFKVEVIPNLYMFKTALMYVLFFYIGFLLRKYKWDWLYRIPSVVYLAADLALFAVNQLISDYSGLFWSAMRFGVSALLHIVGAVMAFIILQRISEHCGRSKVVGFFSKHSMAIYLVHQQLIYFTIGWFNGLVPPIALVAINFVLAFGVSTVFAVLMSKTKVTRFLIGSK